MRRVLTAAAVVVAVLAAPASAALDLSASVLRPADVPAGFRLVEDQSGVRSNARRIRESPPEQRKLLAGWGRVTGYQALYSRRDSFARVLSAVDVFRSGRVLVAFLERQERARKPGGPKVTRAIVGDEGWITTTSFVDGSTRLNATTVNWRQGRVLGSVLGIDVSRSTVLRLARRQEQRIAAALR